MKAKFTGGDLSKSKVLTQRMSKFDSSLYSGSPGALLYCMMMENKESINTIHEKVAAFLIGGIVVPRCKHFFRMRRGYMKEMAALCKAQ